MPKQDSYHDYVMDEVLNQIDGISSRAMFGGWGIYMDGLFFALIADGELYFKVDEFNQKDFEKHGSKPFVYKGHKGRAVTMSYWQLPVDIMEDHGELVSWVEKSVEAAKRSKRK